ncbi:DUF943 family protein [Tatumella sp. OPLPL6]|uniref:DUF943 family protein n=1 Tax=Tatumella sp. OPLPL6 TaxID=1928657 RepID=UPI000C19C67B|nr:DUF943 family protein [Tatumella sp. OPLPL6]PIJ43727.1 hypothetical protein BOM24_06865 [Tatumella sp. OPLPL6]
MSKMKIMILIFFPFFAILTYYFSIILRPVEIIAVHNDYDFHSVLVKNFPFSDKNKIKWWINNQYFLKQQYGIPRPDKEGSFTIIFWNFGEGYKETDGYDRLCFNDVDLPKNCIDKDSLLFVKKEKYTGLEFWGDNGIYRIKENGKYEMRKYH